MPKSYSNQFSLYDSGLVLSSVEQLPTASASVAFTVDSGKVFRGGTGSSRAREFHPHPLTEPYVKVSPHTAIEITIDKKTFFFITA